MNKSQDAITIYHNINSDNSKDDTANVSPLSEASAEIKSNDNNTLEEEKEEEETSPIQLTSSSSSIQLTSPSSVNKKPDTNATTNAILSLKNNPFFYDKRKWDESFTVAEKKELTGNIVKAAKDNDGETYVTLQEEEYTVLNLSHEDEDDSQESDEAEGSVNKKPGRKPMPDEETLSDSDQDPKVKRKAQNRAAQRAFRERKERYVKELEAKLKQVQDTNLITTTQLVRENQQLRSIIYRLEAENYALKGIPLQPYQHQVSLPPQQPQPSPQTRQNGTSHYPTIAPLLPPQQPQQPLLLPAYLSSPAIPNSSILQNSPSVNHMMMLASSPIQQYPMSPVVTTNMTSNNLLPQSPTTTTTTTTKNNHKIPLPISKKVSSKKANTTSPSLKNQPLEYTFSISTPASLRPSGGSVSSSKHNTRSEPVELVQLYPPSGKRKPESIITLKNNGGDSSNVIPSPTIQRTNSISSSPISVNKEMTPNSISNADDTNSIVSDNTSSSINTQLQRKRIQQLESDLFDCHIDTEGQLFCEKLYNEVCNDAFDRLLSEPLFDRMGKLNLSIGNYPVPIMTGRPMSLPQDQNGVDENEVDEHQEKERSNKKKDEPLLSPHVSSPHGSFNTEQQQQQQQKRLLTCPEIWFLLNQHEKKNNFTTDQLCQAVKELAKCSDSGPVLEESDLHQIMTKMDQGSLF